MGERVEGRIVAWVCWDRFSHAWGDSDIDRPSAEAHASHLATKYRKYAPFRVLPVIDPEEAT